MASLYKFGGCVNPSKIRPGNKKPFDSMLGMLGSTPILNINTLTERMNLFQGRALPEVFIKLECAPAHLPPTPHRTASVAAAAPTCPFATPTD